MNTLQIELDDELMERLRQTARTQAVSVETWVQTVLESSLQTQSATGKQYSFIGIGHSGKRHLSRQVEGILSTGANRREGWSLQE